MIEIDYIVSHFGTFRFLSTRNELFNAVPLLKNQ